MSRHEQPERVTAACSEWRRFHADREDQYLDVPGCGRMTIRPSPRGGYTLRVNGEAAGIFPTLEAAMQVAAANAESMRASQAELDAWYAEWQGER
jgi:hypothetical protein